MDTLKTTTQKIVYLFLIFSTFLATISQVFPYTIVDILGISNSKKTFYVRLGKKEGILKGVKGTFTTDNISLVAQAITVTHEYSVWQIVAPNALIPFEKGQTVTFNHALEKVWMLDPDNYLAVKRDQLFDQEGINILQTRRKYFHHMNLSRFFLNGVTQTVSRTDSSKITNRSGAIWTLTYGRNFENGVTWSAGIRYEKETIYSPTINVPSDRLYLVFGPSYHFIPFEKYPRLFISGEILLGIGQSKTKVAWETLAGESYIIPAVQVGVEYFFPKGYGIFLKAGLESITTNEEFESGERQDTQEVNHKIGAGLNIYFR